MFLHMSSDNEKKRVMKIVVTVICCPCCLSAKDFEPSGQPQIFDRIA